MFEASRELSTETRNFADLRIREFSGRPGGSFFGGGFLYGNLEYERVDGALRACLVLCRQAKARGAHVPPSEAVRAKIRHGSFLGGSSSISSRWQVKSTRGRGGCNDPKRVHGRLHSTASGAGGFERVLSRVRTDSSKPLMAAAGRLS